MRSTPGNGGPGPSATGIAMLLWASLITIVLSFVPYASMILYPIRLFVTFVHESSHAATALLTGGSVQEIVIMPTASGYTITLGGIEPLIMMAGYIGASSYGAWLLSLGSKPGRARMALMVSAAIAGGATLLFVRPWHNPFGFFWGIVIAGALIVARRKLSPAGAELLVAFLGIQCALNALLDLRTLVSLSVGFGGPLTDAADMEQITHVPALVWALLWAAISCVVLWRGLLSHRRELDRLLNKTK